MSNGQTPDFIPAAPQQQQAAPDFIPAAPPPLAPKPKTPPGAPQQTMSAAPPLFSKAGLKEKGYQALDYATRALPALGGVVGGIVGAPEGGPAGALAGATLGGAAGKEAEQGARWMIFGEAPPASVKKELKTVATAAAEQGLGEATGQFGGSMLGKLLAPADRTAMMSYATTGGKFSDELKTALPDIDKAAQSAGTTVKTVGEWQPLLQKAIDNNTDELNAALAPTANQQVMPVQVANAIKAKMKTGSAAEDVAYNNVLKQRALDYEMTRPGTQPWTYGTLNKKRIDLQQNPAEYQAGNLIQKAKANANKAADLAAEDEIKTMLYNLADTNVGKPAGYFANMQKRTSAMLTLKKATEDHVDQLVAASTKRAGAPWQSKIPVRIRTWGTGLPRPAAGVTLSPDELKLANQQMRKAMRADTTVFGVKAGDAQRWLADKASSRAGKAVLSLPVRSVFVDKPKKPPQQANQPQMGGTQ